MLIFYDPNDDNQVMASYTEGTTSTVWESRGYTRLEISPSPELSTRIDAYNAQVVLGTALAEEKESLEILLAEELVLAESISAQTRDCKLRLVSGVCVEVIPSLNSVQPQPKQPSPQKIRLQELLLKLKDDTITDIEIRELLRLERNV